MTKNIHVTEHKNKEHMLPLDGLRGLACMIVIFSHIGVILKLNFLPLTGEIGAIGVMIFFALSGFLMSTLYTQETLNFDSSIKYLISRFARIAPAYWIAVVFAWVIYLYIPDFHYQMTPLMMLRSLMFIGTEGVFWSIPPEIQFYIFFLLLWYSWQKMRTGNYYWIIGVILLCVVFIATQEHWSGLTLPSKINPFLSGFFMARAVKNVKWAKILQSIPIQVLSISATLIYSCFLPQIAAYSSVGFAIVVSLMIASLSKASIVTCLLETQSMRLVGAASFSIYLFHDCILNLMESLGWLHFGNWLNIAIMCIVSLAIPVGFHFAVERHLNRSSKKYALFLFEKLKGRWSLKSDGNH